MYYLFGMDAIQRMLSATCGFDAPRELSDPELRRAYHAHLEKASILECRIDWDAPKVLDFYAMEALAGGFFVRKKPFYVCNSAPTQERIRSGYFDGILGQLEQREPSIAALARFVVKVVIVNHLSKYTNGTTEDTLGVANFNFKDEYGRTDFEELLFHQLTHMLLFLDDGATAHMPPKDKAIQIATMIPFVLGGTDFPAYIAFHSYIVAVEMLLYRAATCSLDATPRYHGSTSRILRFVRAFGTSLNANMELFLPRGREILVAADAAFREFERDNKRLCTVAA